MPWKQNPDTGESYWEDEGPQTADANIEPTLPSAGPDATSASPDAVARTKSALDPSSPDYMGPGYTIKDGQLYLPADKWAENQLWVSNHNSQQAQADAATAFQRGRDDALASVNTPDAPNRDALAAFESSVPAAGSRRVATQQAARPGLDVSVTDRSRTNLGAANAEIAANTPVAPGAQAPTVDRSKIDPLLGGLNTYANDIYALSKDNTGLSAAEAQLQKATELANIQAAIQTGQSQRAALGQARSARNRGDRAFLEQQAVGEAGFIGQEAARTKALTDATARGDLANLRATEEDADRRFRLDALSKASDLGLNTAALEVDISKTDLASANNWINNEFQKAGLQMQLDAQKTAQVLNFTRDMAAIQFQYDQLSVEDQNEADKLLMQKYGIDQQTLVALKKIKSDGAFQWDQILAGAAQGATSAIASKAMSDRRTKKNVANVSDDELDELLKAVKAETWDYVDDDVFGGGTRGRRLGPMAQDLKKTRLGASMVLPQPNGLDAVDTGRAGLAALSGLAYVYDKLQGLEAAVK